MNPRNPNYPSLSKTTINNVGTSGQIEAATKRKKENWGKRLAAGVGATALVLGPAKGLLESPKHEAVKPNDPNAVTEVITGPAVDRSGNRFSSGDNYNNAVQRAGERDHDRDGIPNSEDPDVNMYGPDQAEDATGIPANELQPGTKIVAGEIKKP